MSRPRLPLHVLAGVLALASTAAARAAPPPAAEDPRLVELRRLTTLDARAALDVRTVQTRKVGDVTLTELTYASPKGGRVPAFLLIPPGGGPFPAVLFAHWRRGSKNAFLDEALGLARAGVASLLIDAPHVRPEPWRASLHATELPDTLVQWLVDLRRGVDLLSARRDVDGKRLGFVGHGLGASVGGALSGVEPRLRAYVLMNGLGDASTSLELAPPGRAGTLSREEVAALVRRLEPLDGAVGVAHAAPSALFFQSGRADGQVPLARARAFVDAATEPKFAKRYEGGHELGDAARRDRLQWLRTHLGFADVFRFHGPPMIATPTAPGLVGAAIPEWAKARPVLTLPGMDEVRVRRGLTYAREEGREYKLDLYLPDVASREPAPVVVLVHGLLPPALVPLVRDLPAFSGQARWLAAQGLAVALVELGSPATGPEPARWFTDVPRMRERVDAALAFVREKAATEPVDGERVCLMALSAGGLWGLTPALREQPPAWLRCAVAWYPLLEAPGVLQGARPRDALVATEARKLPPLLVVRAGLDTPALNAALDAFTREARARGAPLTLVELPEAPHAFELTDDVEGSRETMRQTARFFEEHLLP